MMKLFKLVWPLSLSLAVLSACEEKNDSDAEQAPAADAAKPAAVAPVPPAPPAPPAAPKEVAVPAPTEVGGQLIAALKSKDDAKVLALSTPATAQALGAEGVKEYIMTALSSGMVGVAKIEGDAATVAVKTGATTQDLPFVKAADGWKFDGAAYLTKYPMPEKDTKHKAVKGKEHTMKKAKSKKHKN